MENNIINQKTIRVLEKYKIKSKVHILGAIDHFEIWDNEIWNKQEDEIDSKFELNAEKIEKLKQIIGYWE